MGEEQALELFKWYFPSYDMPFGLCGVFSIWDTAQRRSEKISSPQQSGGKGFSFTADSNKGDLSGKNAKDRRTVVDLYEDRVLMLK